MKQQSREYPIVSINDFRDTFRIAGNQTFYFKINDIIKLNIRKILFCCGTCSSVLISSIKVKISRWTK